MASYNKLKSGWQYRISYKDQSGQYRTKSENGFKTQSLAKAVAEPLEIMLKSGKASIEASKIPFVDYFWKWFTLYKEKSVSPKTGTHYKQTKDHLEQYFRKVPIGDISDDGYQEFINHFAETHAKETTSKLNTHCRSCFKRAVRQGVIPFDPSENVVVTGKVKPKDERTKYLNESDYHKLMHEIVQGLQTCDASKHLILLTLATGVRYAEAAGLTWDSIDFNKGTVTINKTWDFQTMKFGKTKNEASNRTITIDDITLKYLKDYRKRQMVHPRIKNRLNLVFCTYEGCPPTNNSVNKSLRRALKRAGVTNIITHHGLRHTHVSILIHKKINIKYISRRVGHQNVTTTFDKYSHVIDEMEQTESMLVSDILKEAYNSAK